MLVCAEPFRDAFWRKPDLFFALDLYSMLVMEWMRMFFCHQNRRYIDLVADIIHGCLQSQ